MKVKSMTSISIPKDGGSQGPLKSTGQERLIWTEEPQDITRTWSPPFLPSGDTHVAIKVVVGGRDASKSEL